MRVRRTVDALHEPQRAAGILPAEKARLCRRDVGSTLPSGTYFAKVHGPNACAKRMEALSMNLKMLGLRINNLRILRFMPKDEVTNCAFGGEDRKTLFVTAGGTLWSIRVNTPGQSALNGGAK